MSDVTATGPSTPATVEQLAVPRAMIAATEPYCVAARLSRDFDDDVKDDFWEAGIDVEHLVSVDAKGRLICFEKATTETLRWRLGDDARYALRRLPTYADVLAAHRTIRRDLDTEPPIESRVDLVCLMLDLQNIKASDACIQPLAWRLGDCPQPRKTEIHRRKRPWFSLATISSTVDEVATTMRPEYGRRCRSPMSSTQPVRTRAA